MESISLTRIQIYGVRVRRENRKERYGDERENHDGNEPLAGFNLQFAKLSVIVSYQKLQR